MHKAVASVSHAPHAEKVRCPDCRSSNLYNFTPVIQRVDLATCLDCGNRFNLYDGSKAPFVAHCMCGMVNRFSNAVCEHCHADLSAVKTDARRKAGMVVCSECGYPKKQRIPGNYEQCGQWTDTDGTALRLSDPRTIVFT